MGIGLISTEQVCTATQRCSAKSSSCSHTKVADATVLMLDARTKERHRVWGGGGAQEEQIAGIANNEQDFHVEHTIRSRTRSIAVVGTVGGWSAATRAAARRDVSPRQQAAAGQAAYAQSCAACHGRTLSGGGEAPALAGSTFMGTWGTHTTQELFTRIRTSMPPENPNGLSADTYASIVAFLLKANGAQAGSSAFTPATSVPIASIANGQMPAEPDGCGRCTGARPWPRRAWTGRTTTTPRHRLRREWV